MIMWRPKDWVNPYLKSSIPEWEAIRKAFEAGADAYEAALKKQAISENHDEDDYIAIEITKGTGLEKGWLVFIPEEG